jgi:hypothetical protein
MNDRYELKNLPISEATLKGLTPENIDSLGATGRMMSVQDNFIEELLDQHSKRQLEAIERLCVKVDCIEKRLATQEKINGIPSIVIRWVSGVVAAVYITWYLFTNFWHK